MNPSPKTKAWLNGVLMAACSSGRPDEEFFYLGGPMSGIPAHNFPRFDEVASKLRGKGYNIVSPAELDDPRDREKYMADDTGTLAREDYDRLLGRDIVTVALPTCIGGIFIEGWENSRGAAAETWVLSYLNRPLYEYHEQRCPACAGAGMFRYHTGPGGAEACEHCEGAGAQPILVNFDRDEHLLNIHGDPSVAGIVPTHEPGERTMAARIETYEAQKAVHEFVHPPGSGNPFPNLRQKGLV